MFDENSYIDAAYMLKLQVINPSYLKLVSAILYQFFISSPNDSPFYFI